jgi:hypothetical protein
MEEGTNRFETIEGLDEKDMEMDERTEENFEEGSSIGFESIKVIDGSIDDASFRPGTSDSQTVRSSRPNTSDIAKINDTVVKAPFHEKLIEVLNESALLSPIRVVVKNESYFYRQRQR